MDITIKRIIVKDSFGEIETLPYPFDFPISTYTGRVDVNYVPRYGEHELLFTGDLERYMKLQQIKTYFNSDGFESARDLSNPFETIGRSVLMNRAAIKLANIDFVFQILNENWSMVNMKSNTEFTFADIGSAPGGFSQYIMYRLPNSTGVGMSLRSGIQWNTSQLSERLNILWGSDGTGDLLVNWKWLLAVLINKKVDLITADGAFETDNPNLQEISTIPLILAQSIQVLGLKENGHFVMKIFDCNTKIMADILYTLSTMFNYMVIFKPCSSRPANAERYVVFKNKISNLYSEKVLYNLINTGITNVNSFVDNLPQDFINYLVNINQDDIKYQHYYCTRILSLMLNEPIDRIEVDTNLALTVWSLPDNISVYTNKDNLKPGQTKLKVLN